MEKKGNFKYFIILWIGEFVSVIGSGISAFALAIFVYQKTGEATQLSLLTLFSFMPNVLLTPFAGSLADRYNRRILMLIGDSFSAIGILFIFFNLLNGNDDFLLILVGVTISSIFSSLLEPSYRATISEILSPEEFSQASGFVQMAGAAKFLLAPIIAGFLLKFMPIHQILLIDIGTFIVTVLTIIIVINAPIKNQVFKPLNEESVFKSLYKGWRYMRKQQGILTLIIAMTVVTFSIGFLQTLIKPMMLEKISVAGEGMFESICAVGMLVSSIIIGIINRNWKLQRTLGLSIVLFGIMMSMLGFNFPVIILGVFCFSFFSVLPFVNMSADILLRSNVSDDYQGRVWGITGLVSQLGFIISYAISGPLADYVFNPLLNENGLLAESLGPLFGVGPHRGIGLLFFITGILMSLVGLFFWKNRNISKLETVANSIKNVENSSNKSLTSSAEV